MVIEIENLSFSFLGAKRSVLKNVNLRIKQGEFVAILGPNGCGKTTLALCMTGIIPHFFQGRFEGRVLINGKDTRENEIHDIISDVGILMQDYESQLFFPRVEDEIRFQIENFGISSKKMEEISKEMKLYPLVKRNPLELSEGEKQRVIIASILVTDPDILILDEPTSQLDSEEREHLLGILRHLNAHGKTIILITHNTHFARYCSRFLVIRDGRIVEDTRDRGFLEKAHISDLGIEPINYNWDNHKISTSNDLQIIIRDLSYKVERPVLKKISADIGNGEFILILGKNGSGKTTLVKHLNKLLKVQKGRIIINGKSIEDYSQREIAKLIGFIFQNPEHQIFRNSVEDEIRFTLDSLGLNEDNLNKTLELFNLKEYRDRSPHAFSTGEKQRIALASVLVSEPDIIILDEPMTYLDFEAKKHLIEYLRAIKKSGKTIIVISHYPDYYKSLTDRRFIIADGKISEE